MKKIFALLLTLLVLCAGCGGDGKKLDVKNAEPLKPIEIKNPKIEAIQDAKLKQIAKEIDANLKKNDAIAEFGEIKFSKGSTTNVLIKLDRISSKPLSRKRIFNVFEYAFKSTYKADQSIKNANIRLVNDDKIDLCVIEMDRETEKQITWSEADKMKDWNKIAELYLEMPKMRETW